VPHLDSWPCTRHTIHADRHLRRIAPIDTCLLSCESERKHHFEIRGMTCTLLWTGRDFFAEVPSSARSLSRHPIPARTEPAKVQVHSDAQDLLFWQHRCYNRTKHSRYYVCGIGEGALVEGRIRCCRASGRVRELVWWESKGIRAVDVLADGWDAESIRLKHWNQLDSGGWPTWLNLPWDDLGERC
jgi:hypothetical protein